MPKQKKVHNRNDIKKPDNDSAAQAIQKANPVPVPIIILCYLRHVLCFSIFYLFSSSSNLFFCCAYLLPNSLDEYPKPKTIL